MRSTILLILIIITAIVAKDEKVFVRNFSSTSIDSAQCASLSNLFASELKHFSTWDIITYGDVASMLEQEMDKELLDCDDESCMQEIAGALGAPLMVSGDITKVGSYYIINISLLHSLEGRSVRKVSERSKSIDGLIELFASLAQRIAGKQQHQAVSAEGGLSSEEVSYSFNQVKQYLVRFESDPPGAIVFVDGNLVTSSSPGQRALSAGSHHVKMSRELYHNWEGVVTVEKNGQVVIGTLRPAFGYLSVESNLAGVPIFVDDSLIGQTPLSYATLSEGNHAISLGGPCFVTQKGIITIMSDSTKQLHVTMKHRLAWLQVNAIDSSTGSDMIADVVLDGEKVGTTPFSESVPLCSKTLEVSARGYQDQYQELSLKEGKASTYAITLAPPPLVIQESTYRGTSVYTPQESKKSAIAKLFFEAQLAASVGWAGKFGNRYSGQGVEFQFQMPVYGSLLWYMGYSRTFNNRYTNYAKQQIIDDYNPWDGSSKPTLEQVVITGTTREISFGMGVPLFAGYIGMFWEDYTPNYTSYGRNDDDYSESTFGITLGARTSIPFGKKIGLAATVGYGWETELNSRFFETSIMLSYFMGSLW